MSNIDKEKRENFRYTKSYGEEKIKRNDGEFKKITWTKG